MISLENKIKIVSLFSGGGFLDMGFEKAGFEVVFSNEIDKDFAKFYEEGMSSWAGEPKKISHIGPAEKTNLSVIEKNREFPFGIIGGPPCQDFSIRGMKNGFDGLRGTLTFHFYERVLDLQPDFFLMENVPGLVLLKKTKTAFNSILDLFRQDYDIDLKQLNALHYGVPQNRMRLFVFGIKRNITNSLKNNLEKECIFDWPSPLYPNAENIYKWGEPESRTYENTLFSLPAPPPNLCVQHILIGRGDQQIIKNAGEFFMIKNINKIKEIEEGDTYRPSFKRLHRKKYSPAACYGNNEVHLHPFYNRRLSVREALRIQGVPDSYVLSTQGKLSKKFKMIGNGVPVPLSYKMALSIKEFFRKLLIVNDNQDGYLVKEEEK